MSRISRMSRKVTVNRKTTGKVITLVAMLWNGILNMMGSSKCAYYEPNKWLKVLKLLFE